jgi:hypothetical protein
MRVLGGLVVILFCPLDVGGRGCRERCKERCKALSVVERRKQRNEGLARSTTEEVQ